MEELELEIQELIKDAKRNGSVISEDAIGEKLINFELSAKDMKSIKEKLEDAGITIDESVDDVIKDEELKLLISNAKVDDPVKNVPKRYWTISVAYFRARG